MGHFQVLFSGELTPGADPARVRRGLAEKFGIDAHKVNQLFSGRTVVLRSQLDETGAIALQRELEGLGARTRIKDRTPQLRDPFEKVGEKGVDTERKVARDPTLKDITAAHFECPRCGFLQLEAEHCVRCGVNIAIAMREKQKEDKVIEKRIRELRERQARVAQHSRNGGVSRRWPQGRNSAPAGGREAARGGTKGKPGGKGARGGWWRRLWPGRDS